MTACRAPLHLLHAPTCSSQVCPPRLPSLHLPALACGRRNVCNCIWKTKPCFPTLCAVTIMRMDSQLSAAEGKAAAASTQKRTRSASKAEAEAEDAHDSAATGKASKRPKRSKAQPKYGSVKASDGPAGRATL